MLIYDRNGRFSALRAAVLAATLAPALWILIQWRLGSLMPRELEEVIHQTGLWSVRLLMATLAVTPLRHIGGWPKLIGIRRMLGLAALAYGVAHLAFYCIDQNLDWAKIASEIVLRTYLTVGIVALLGMAALGVTSTDGMIRWMGAAAWRRLHMLVHPIAILAVLHFFMQSKIEAGEATLMLGFLVLVEIHRFVIRRRLPLTFATLAIAAAAAAAATALLEAGWYAAATNVPASAVIEANLYLDLELRPSWWVLAVGLSAAMLGNATHRRLQPAAKRMPDGRLARSAG